MKSIVYLFLFLFTLVVPNMSVYAIENTQDKDRFETFISSFFGTKQDVTVRPLSGGWSMAKLYYLKTNDKEYVVRFQDLASSACAKERYMSEKASQRHIAPQVYHIDPEQGVIVMDYINNSTTISIQDAQTPSSIRAMARSLQKVHEIPKVSYPINRLLDDVHDQYSSLKKLGLVNESIKTSMLILEQLQKKLDSYRFPQTMIHGDLHMKNIFLTNKGTILFIDWEGARYDDPFFDIARSACTFNFTPEQERTYVTEYLGHKVNANEWQHYKLCKNITILAFHIELSKFAYAMNDNKPFIDMCTPVQPWSWYMQQFVENKEKPSAEYIFSWANSVLKLYDSHYEMINA